MRCGRCAYSEGRCQQGSCSHACRISAVNKCKRIGEKTEGPNIKSIARGVPQIEKAILGEAFLGGWLRSVEYMCDTDEMVQEYLKHHEEMPNSNTDVWILESE